MLKIILVGSLRRLRILLLMVIISFTLSTCTHIPHSPKTANFTGTIDNIFEFCHNPANNTLYPIAYKVTVNTYYRDGTTDILLDSKPLSSGTPPSTSISFTIKYPIDGTSWHISYLIYGAQCSTCAVQNYPGDPCFQTRTVINGKSGTYAAEPVLAFIGITTSGAPVLPYHLSARNAAPADNVQNTCNCFVPDTN